MFDFSASSLAVPDDLQDLFTSTWTDIASPGSGWSGAEKVAIAARSRTYRCGDPDPDLDVPLPPAAHEAIEMITIEPSGATESWVRHVISQIGETRYVEVVGVVAAVTGADVMTEFLVGTHEPLPPPIAGRTVPDRNPRARRGRAWVSMAGPPLPRNALSAVPATQRTANRLLKRLYLGDDERRDPGPARGLNRVHVELVATTVSYGNKCFYCTMGHLIALRARAEEQELELDHRAIVEPGIDPGIEGGREVIALAVEATKAYPDSKSLTAVADVVGPQAAVTALEVAVSFMMTNRIIEATGQPVLANQREKMMPLLQEIGADTFPHSGIAAHRESPGTIGRIRRKLAGSRRRGDGRAASG